MSAIDGDQSSRSLKYKMFIFFNYSTTSLKHILTQSSLLLGFDLLFRSSNEYLFGEAADVENKGCHVRKNYPINEGQQGAREVFGHELIEEWEHFY